MSTGSCRGGCSNHAPWSSPGHPMRRLLLNSVAGPRASSEPLPAKQWLSIVRKDGSFRRVLGVAVGRRWEWVIAHEKVTGVRRKRCGGSRGQTDAIRYVRCGYVIRVDFSRARALNFLALSRTPILQFAFFAKSKSPRLDDPVLSGSLRIMLSTRLFRACLAWPLKESRATLLLLSTSSANRHHLRSGLRLSSSVAIPDEK